ncbi:MAG: hypothetical protein L0191_02995, partial [Acidobacteria bacterium]|nr:hypothetical protein [Acidobacteriota bacterium]
MSTATTDPLRRWFAEFLRLQGAETEAAGDDPQTIEALIPPALAEQTGWMELDRFTFSPEAAAGDRGRAHLVSYHSGVLE